MNPRASYSVSDICIIALFTALISILAQISIPLPGGVPLTMQTFAVLLTGIVLGRRKGCTAATAYILLGALGVPVFSNFGAGISRLAGPSGGFLLSYPLMAWTAGYSAERVSKPYIAAGLAAANAICYAMGCILFSFITGSGMAAALAACVAPFLMIDLLKTILAGWAGFYLRKALRRAGVH